MVHDGLEIVSHQPLLDQVWLRERTPDLFRRMRNFSFENDAERFGRPSLIHPFEQIFEVVESALPEPDHLARPVDQRGERAELRAIVRLATSVPVAYQPGLL
jgi:hypothetical protein